MELHRSVAAFFHEAVTEALRARSVTAAEPTEFYLVNLLVEFTRSPDVGEEPLALKLASAAEAAPAARARMLKNIGDTSLYMTGFFADNLSRKMVAKSYYIELGERAYGQLASLQDRLAQSAADFYKEAFDELAEKFAQYVDVFGEVRKSTGMESKPNVLRLCEEWVCSGEEWIEERLKETGVVAAEAFGKKLIH